MNLKEILTASMVLFAVIDIVGSIPIVISLREKAGHIQSEKASLVAAIIMIAFLFFGRKNIGSYRNRCQFFCRGWFLCDFLFGFGNDFGNYTVQRRSP
jgi:hypothetical protein